MSVASLGRPFAAALVFASFFGALSAQTLSVGSGGSLTGGTDVSVSYHDSSRAGQTIVVRITSNGPTPTSEEHYVVLDADGRGSFTWRVPTTWDKAYFNAPGATEVARAVL